MNNLQSYAMYLRKSRADLELENLGEGETLTRHYEILSALAAKRGVSMNQIVVYREVVSGESIAARPEMQRLLNDVYLKKYAGVFCMEVERLARGNTKDQGEVSDAFQYSGTHIITPVKEYDPQNEFDQEYFEFGLFMSRREYKTIKRRMEAGRIQSMREGNYVGSLRPYGYDIQRVNKRERILIINEAEAPIVRLIFDLFTVERLTCGQIAKRLSEAKIPTLTGKPEWNRGSIADILRNPHYAGFVRWNRRRCTKEFDETGLQNRKRRLSTEEQEIHPGKHKAIISKEQFDLAQTLFTGQAPVKAMTTQTNPLAGLLCCKDCGKKMVYATFATRENTMPRFTHPSSIVCQKKSAAESVVMSALVDSLKRIIEDYEIRLRDDYSAAERRNAEALISSMKEEKGRLERKKQRLFDSWEADDGTYTRDEFIERKQMYDAALDDIKKQIQAAEMAKPESVNYEDEIITLQELIKALQSPTVSAKAKNDFLKEHINKISYDSEDLGRGKGTKPILEIYLK